MAEQGKPAKLLDSAYRGDLPEGHNGFGLATVGRRGDEMVDADTYAEIKARTLQTVRGTVQADILKEDQAQNTCIFSTPFALKLMGDVQQYYIDHGVRNHYSVSISGYHIAEAGANPITQLALTLANGFTYVEYYRSRGMDINKFAPNLSFFFSNGLDPEYTVIGRVARRIWAVTMRDMYGADERSQKLKYHIQTSGRSLHAQEIDFNDIRTTLQALLAIQDNANSLHTNAYDEAITTPTEESVRRALAIQLIVNKESGWTKTENPMQGAYIVDELTDLVEEAVLQEFEAISRRGGVLGAMETMYQRGKIQDESMYYEHLKHDGTLPIIGVNTFQNPNAAAFDESAADDFEMEFARATPEEKEACLERVVHRQTVDGEATQAALAQATARGRTTRRERVRGTDGDREGGEPRSNHRCAVQRRWTVSAQHVRVYAIGEFEPGTSTPTGRYKIGMTQNERTTYDRIIEHQTETPTGRLSMALWLRSVLPRGETDAQQVERQKDWAGMVHIDSNRTCPGHERYCSL